MDLARDLEHCGACHHPCQAPTGGVAQCDPDGGGRCLTCPEGQAICSGACVDLSTSVDHCGGCGLSCAGGPCRDARCEDIVIASGLDAPTALAASGGTVFWLDENYSQTQLVTFAGRWLPGDPTCVGHGTPCTRSLDHGGSQPIETMTANDRGLFLLSEGKVYQFARDLTAPLTRLPDIDGARGIVGAGADLLWWTERGTAAVSVRRSDEPSTPLITRRSDDDGPIVAVTVAGAEALAVVGIGLSGNPRVVRQPKGGPPCSAEACDVLFTGHDDRPSRVDRAPPGLFVRTLGGRLLHRPSSVTCAEESCWTELADGFPKFDAYGFGGADATNVYVATSSAVYRVALGGHCSARSCSVVFQGALIWRIAGDDRFLYVGYQEGDVANPQPGRGFIRRIAK